MLVEKQTRQQIAMHYDLYVPEPAKQKALPLLIALHGYEGNKESMMALAQKINREDFIIASVQGPNGFFLREERAANRPPRIGFGWMMTYKAGETIDLHHRTLRSVIADTVAEHPVDRGQIFLLAFSQSVSLNYRFAFTHPNTIRGIIAVCGGIPGDWNEDKYKPSDTDVLIIAGETDEFYPLERTRTFADAIARRARTAEFKSFPTGHIFMRESLPVINQWLLEKGKRQK
jgi:predicted esterase